MAGLNIQFNNMDSALRAAKLFELRKQITLSIFDGKFKQARANQKEFAKLAVQDFDTFVKVPTFKFTNIPLKAGISILRPILKFKLFSMFSKKTPEEKELAKMYKDYVSKDKLKNKVETININSF